MCFKHKIKNKIKNLIIRIKLAKLGIDIIEAGFPATSNNDFEAMKTIAKEVGNVVDANGYIPVICGLSRCNEKDIRKAWEAIKYAKRPRIHGQSQGGARGGSCPLELAKKIMYDILLL